MSDLVHVARAVLGRNLKHAFKNPALLVPSILFPLIFLVAFAGGLSAIGDVPGFDYPPGYTTFQFAFVFLQSAAFGGVFTGLAIAQDFESGFTQRLLLGSPRRTGIIVGYVLAGMTRFVVTGVFISITGVLAGMAVDGNVLDVGGLAVLGLVVNAASTLFATGVSMRAKSMQAGPAMQIPIFLILFLAPVYVPRELLQGWIHTAAGLNPATAFLTAARSFLSGAEQSVGLAFASAAALAALMYVFALRGLRRAEAGR